jgi:uncharacterized OB-fold protein
MTASHSEKCGRKEIKNSFINFSNRNKVTTTTMSSNSKTDFSFLLTI